jgi:phosphatidate cytidylyltransferase
VTPAGMGSRSGKAKIAPQSSDMPKRMVSAFVLAAVGLFAIVASRWTFAGLVAIAGIIVAWEWARLVRGRRFDGAMIVQAATVAAMALFVTIGRSDFAAAAACIGVAGIILTGFSSYTLGWSLLGFFYAVAPAWSLLWLRNDSDYGTIYGTMALLYLIGVATLTDTASYAGGRLIGGPKLAPRISPHKTWSGLIVGIVAPALAGLAFAHLLQETSWWRLAIISVVLGAACQLGDLTESAIKRRFGVKDMSGLIPGHGGLLDRIDGLFFAAMAAAMIAALRNPASPGGGLLLW